MIRVICKCGRQRTVARDRVGHSLQCERCGRSVVVPDAPRLRLEAPAGARPHASSDDDAQVEAMAAGLELLPPAPRPAATPDWIQRAGQARRPLDRDDLAGRRRVVLGEVGALGAVFGLFVLEMCLDAGTGPREVLATLWAFWAVRIGLVLGALFVAYKWYFGVPNE